MSTVRSSVASSGVHGSVFESTVIESIYALTDKVNELKSDVKQLKMSQRKMGGGSPNASRPKPCLLYVHVSAEIAVNWSHCWGVRCCTT